MGPRQGSPAAETQRKRSVSLSPGAEGQGWWLSLLLIALWSYGFFPSPAWAASAEFSHNVSVVVVPPELSFKNEGEDPALSFSRRSAGTESSSYQSSYRISSNTLPESSYDGVISAKIEQKPEGIVLQADVGSFSNNGTIGNTILYENKPGYQAVGNELIPLASKEATSGSQAGVLNGTLPILWKAISQNKLDTKEQLLVITVTLKDA